MEKIFVFADFDWLKEPQKIGELCYERLRGSDSYAFFIDSSTNKADLKILLDSCEDYMLGKKEAKEIISEVLNAMRGWEQLAYQLQISKREQQLFGDRFNRNLSFGM